MSCGWSTLRESDVLRDWRDSMRGANGLYPKRLPFECILAKDGRPVSRGDCELLDDYYLSPHEGDVDLPALDSMWYDQCFPMRHVRIGKAVEDRAYRGGGYVHAVTVRTMYASTAKTKTYRKAYDLLYFYRRFKPAT